MARRKRKVRRYGMHHDPQKVNRMAYRTKGKKLKVNVSVSRSATGHYGAIACVVSNPKQHPMSYKGAHCSGLRGGTTPTKAAANALEELGQSLKKYGR